MEGEQIDEATRLKATAYHEAGHAVAACALRRDFDYATIEPEEDSLGHVRYAPFPLSFINAADISVFSFDDLQFAEVSIICSLAGGVAQSRIYEPHDYEVEQDKENAVDLLFRIIQSDDISGPMEWFQVKTRALLEQDYVYSDAVEAVADMLLEQKRVPRQKIVDCIEEIRAYSEALEQQWLQHNH